MNTNLPAWSTAEAREALDEVRALRRYTRKARQGFWFSLVALGALVLLSSAGVVFGLLSRPRPQAA